LTRLYVAGAVQFIAAVVQRIAEKLESVEPHAREETVLLFSAHGVPMQARDRMSQSVGS
jgi:protoheme ferro-lyase